MDVRQLIAQSEFANTLVRIANPEMPRFDSLERMSLTLLRGSVLKLRINVKSSLPLGFQWYFGSLGMKVEQPIPGQQSQVLLMPTHKGTQSGHYRCKVTNDRYPDGLFSRWFFVVMRCTDRGPEKRIFIRAKRLRSAIWQRGAY